jgi:hypothetical protein
MDAGSTLMDTSPEFGGASLGAGDNSAKSRVRSASSISFSFHRRRIGTIVQALAASMPTLVTVEIIKRAICSAFAGKSHTTIVDCERLSFADLVHSWMECVK